LDRGRQNSNCDLVLQSTALQALRHARFSELNWRLAKALLQRARNRCAALLDAPWPGTATHPQKAIWLRGRAWFAMVPVLAAAGRPARQRKSRPISAGKRGGGRAQIAKVFHKAVVTALLVQALVLPIRSTVASVWEHHATAAVRQWPESTGARQPSGQRAGGNSANCNSFEMASAPPRPGGFGLEGAAADCCGAPVAECGDRLKRLTAGQDRVGSLAQGIVAPAHPTARCGMARRCR